MSNDLDDDIPFSASFPLPFRAVFLGGLGLLGWATNLHGLYLLGVDAASALELSSHDDNEDPPLPLPHAGGSGHRSISRPSLVYAPVYRLFAVYSLWSFGAWCIFRYATSASISLVDSYKHIPAVCMICLLMILVCPFDFFQKRERDLFLRSLRRCLFTSINKPVYFSDVVFADIITSFAKVIGDVWLSICILMPGGSLLLAPSQEGLSWWVVPTLMSLPYAVRFRQCLFEYLAPSNSSTRPLYNALKYGTSFPVIFLSAAQRIVMHDLIAMEGEAVTKVPWHGEHLLFRLWLFSVVVNSLYSFWWDVTNDWGLDLLKTQTPSARAVATTQPLRPLVLPELHRSSTSTSSIGTTSPHSRYSSSLSPSSSVDLASGRSRTSTRTYPYGLRPILLFPLPVYPLAVTLDLVLRLTWSLKLSAHLHSHADGGRFIFGVEAAEVVRRWMWVFLRVEWEVVKRETALVGSNGNGDGWREEEIELERKFEDNIETPEYGFR